MSKADRFSANEFSSELLGCIGIDVSGDEAGVHPPNIGVKYRLFVYWYSSALAEGRFFFGEPVVAVMKYSSRNPTTIMLCVL